MKNFLVLVCLLVTGTSCNWASDFPVVVNGSSAYAIVTPATSTPNEVKAAKILQEYILRATGVTLPVTKENAWADKPAFFIGRTQKAIIFNTPEITGEGYFMASDNQDIVICGGSGKGVVYGVYDFLETYMGGNKYDSAPGKVTEYKILELPSGFRHEYTPAMVYRQAYYPMSRDAEYLDWHKLHNFEDLWGIWGHSYFKLVDPRKYYKTHPEYYAMQNGKRLTTQLCMSNDEVVKIATEELTHRISNNPEALYWSISAEDDLGYCTCDKCKAINDEEGTPSGAHLRFVNKIAGAFPEKTFTTLAYTYTARPPLKTKPLSNVYIMLSTIDAYRTAPLETEPSAAPFRRSLEGWEKLTSNLFVWDYTTQFTNYLAPLPDLFVLGPNISYFAAHHVKGVFSQGSGETYGEFAELKSYVVSRILWNPHLNPNQLIEDFCTGYYKGAGKYILEYIKLIQAESHKSNRHIDIYGNPVNEYNSYLTPQLLDQYSALFDKAEGAVEETEKVLQRVQRLRLSLEYVVLQQSRFYGTEQHGYFTRNENGFTVKENWPARVKRFTDAANKFAVTELSEGGLSPNQYLEEWQHIFARGWKPNLAAGSTVTLKHAYVPDYPAKKERTLVDEVMGEHDYSYNWLCFSGDDMVATIDMGTEKEVSSINMNFLDDPRHWFFLPEDVEVSVSIDGNRSVKAKASANNPDPASGIEEHYEIKPVNYSFSIKAQKVRFIRITAKNRKTIPYWRFRPNRRPMLGCDEVFVN
jgi:hypothetical protein